MFLKNREEVCKQASGNQRFPSSGMFMRPYWHLIASISTSFFVCLLVIGTFLTSDTAFAYSEKQNHQQNSVVASQPAATSKTWYFAEGAVGGTFQEYLTLFNPNTVQAVVSATYLFQTSRPALSLSYTVQPRSRTTVNVNQDVHVALSDPLASVATILTSTIPIVAERPMYFTLNGISSGSNALGATNANSSTFYFAEGDARPGYYTWVSILNPSSTTTAHVIIRYYSGGSRVGFQVMDIGPMKRATGSPNSIGLHQSVAIQVESTSGIVVERPMYFNTTIPNAGGLTTGAASLVGATHLGKNWLFAEGYTGPNFQEYLILANFTYADTTASVKLLYANGSTQTVPVTIKALSQFFLDVNAAFAHPAPGSIPTTEVSAEVTANTPSIVVERLMYFHYGGQLISGGTDALGEIGPPNHAIYNFAEGFVSPTFSEYLTLENPTNASETAVITLFFNHTTKQVTRSLPAHSRTTLMVNHEVGSLPGSGYEVAMTVQSLSGAIIAERPMYFTWRTSAGGTVSLGFTGDSAADVAPCASDVPAVSPDEIDIGNTTKNQVALTFDAGGDVAPASSILNTLNAQGVHATWFFTGVWAQQNPVLVSQVAKGGYEIGNHTMTHPDLATIASVEECKQLKQADGVISSITGRTTTRPYFRPPYGSRNAEIRQGAANLGYRTVMWTIDTLDWQADSTPERILQIISDHLTPGAIILMHAGSASEAQVLDRVITMLHDKGYELKTLTEVMQ